MVSILLVLNYRITRNKEEEDITSKSFVKHNNAYNLLEEGTDRSAAPMLTTKTSVSMILLH